MVALWIMPMALVRQFPSCSGGGRRLVVDVQEERLLDHVMLLQPPR